jgi:hypothetical protein
MAGLYLYTWTASGTVTSVSSDQFTVVAAQRALVASMEEFKAHLNRSDATDDQELYTYLVTATDRVEAILSGPLSVQTFTEKVWCGGCRIVPFKRPMVSVTSVTPELGGSALASTAFTVDTDHHVIRLLTAYAYGWYILVYRAGLSTIPEEVKLAGLIIADHLWKVQNGSGGRGAPGEDDLLPSGFGFAIPRRALELLAHDMAPGFA